MDSETLGKVREALNTIHTDARGCRKPLRYFTAEDCRGARAPELGLVADVIESASLVTVGEAVAREDALAGMTCPRCTFEYSIAEMVYAAEFIAQNYHDPPEALSASEQRLLGLGREWLADDTIVRCLNQESDDASE